MEFKNTNEQDLIVNDAIDPKTEVLSINAGSGCGKTSSLKLVSDALNKPSLYLAFNKSMAQEAGDKFKDHVDCMTTHSLAYRKIGSMYQHKLSRPTGRYRNVCFTASEIARFFKLPDFVLNPEDVTKKINKNFIGQIVKETVSSFEQSDRLELEDKHVPRYRLNKIKKDLQKDKVKDDKINKILNKFIRMVVRYASDLWEERIDTTSEVMISHDTYLKLFQLRKEKLEQYEVIYLDEAQDTSRCVLDIFKTQTHALRILVGDTYQNIYGWRGSVNAMEEITEAKRRRLTKSFRFGEDLAHIANKILDGRFALTGDEAKVTRVGDDKSDAVDYEKPYTILFRTNMELILRALTMLQNGDSVDVNLDTYDFVQKLKSIQALKDGNMKGVKHEDILPFLGWWDITNEAKNDPELGRLCKIVESGETDNVITTLHNYKPSGKKHINLITAHRSKGLEFDQVVLAEDFPSIYDKKGKYVGLNDQETNLLYVAATRAKSALQYNSTVTDLINHKK